VNQFGLIDLISVLLFGGVVFCLFLALLNRVLILIPDSRIKTPLILSVFGLLSGLGLLAGFMLARPPWLYLPAGFFFLVVIGEVRRLFIRRSCRGTPPVDSTPHQVDIANPITTTDLVVHRYHVPHRKWHGPPLRIVHLTDLHVHPGLPREYYQRVFSAAEEMDADIAVLTGDFVSSIAGLQMLREVLRPIAKLATFAVLGNHDYWVDAEAVRGVVRACHLQLLTDETQEIVFGSNKITVTGYDYPWGNRDRSGPSFQDEDALHVVLSHTPDNIYRLSAASADLVFAGHFHAGQIRLPVLGPIVIPSVYGRRFDHGHFVVDRYSSVRSKWGGGG
jgi:predicted MPP superfamily phosphohydrolase